MLFDPELTPPQEIEERYVEIAIKRLEQSVFPFEDNMRGLTFEIAANRLAQGVLF